MRKAMVGGFGGTMASEHCIAGSLNWLARHQSEDGSWAFDTGRKEKKTFSNPGNCQSRTG